MALSGKTLRPQSKHKVLIIACCVVAVLAILGFVVYTFLGYGGPRGYWQAHERFPGYNATALRSGRSRAEKEISAATAQLSSLTNIGTITVLPQQRQDLCVKGDHTLGIAGASENDYAYSCSLDTEIIIAYGAPECDVAQVLLNNSISFGSGTKDCSQEESPKNIGGNFGVGNNDYSQVSIDTTEHYLKYFDVGVNSIQKCDSPQVVVYCSTQNISGNEVQNSLKTIPVSAQTIIEYAADVTYYTK
jgi:hypothetical protein